MDYHAIHGYDRASFDTPGAHRLPTVSASQALDELGEDTPNNVISTGLADLDQALSGSTSPETEASSHGGVKRGQVTEIWGPPGTGKTALGLQLAANALCDGNAVVWVDCFQVIQTQRLESVLITVREGRGVASPEEADESDGSRFHHYSCLTLAHLIALASGPTTRSIPTKTSLIVINSPSALVNAALPKGHDEYMASKSKGPSPATKRMHALQSIINALHKLAATRNCAVVILSQCATKMHSERGAMLVAAVNATVWEQGVSTRLVLFRDWVWQGIKLIGVFLAGLQKVDAQLTHEAVERIVAFKVGQGGVSTVPYDAIPSMMDTTGHKRKLGQTELEVPDSEDDEDYGWADEDEAAMPGPPPQWQGSEDILLGQEVGRSEDENSDGNKDGDEEE